MRRDRYLEKLETFETELNFINSHAIVDEVSERALLHSLQVCVEISTDLIAMLAYDLGLVVEDDYTNIENLTKEAVFGEEDNQILKSYNGLRDAIVHRYNNLNMERIEEGLVNINSLYQVIVKLAEVYNGFENI